MKIILSRKGFDSSNGGFPSIILPSKEMLSLPIPSCYEGDYKYSDITTKNDGNLFDIMKQCIGEKIQLGKKDINLTEDIHCHLDPFLGNYSVKETNCWNGIFGQEGASAGHLRNEEVNTGDIFIFFGWFDDVEIINGHYQYVNKGEPKGKHTMFGYLEIGEKYENIKDVPQKYKNHPHVINQDRKNNTIFIASEKFTLNPEFKGYGIFKYNPELDLTKKEDGTYMNRTCWMLPEFFKNLKISYHKSESFKDEYFKAANIGQEFVIKNIGNIKDITVEGGNELKNWTVDLIRKYSVNKY